MEYYFIIWVYLVQRETYIDIYFMYPGPHINMTCNSRGSQYFMIFLSIVFYDINFKSLYIFNQIRCYCKNNHAEKSRPSVILTAFSTNIRHSSIHYSTCTTQFPKPQPQNHVDTNLPLRRILNWLQFSGSANANLVMQKSGFRDHVLLCRRKSILTMRQ